MTEAQFELMLGAFREQHNDQSNRTKWLGRRRMTKSFFPLMASPIPVLPRDALTAVCPWLIL